MKRIFTLLFALLIVAAADAQTTTSSIAGHITDENNNPVIGAVITATHLPTSTLYGTHSSESGAFHIEGMRAGGPYKIEVSCVGYSTVMHNDIVLALGEESRYNVVLKESININDIVVVASNTSHSHNNGNYNFDSNAIESVATISRSFYDVVRLAPQVVSLPEGGMSIGGANNRYNSFQIDGIPSNDMYGLTPSGTNGGLTNANPLPLDAISEIRVSSSPFDVRESGFTGGSINVNTKSGTNTFTGSVYAYYNNNRFYGNGANNTPLAEQSTQTYGASFGGAIIRDKLFFFVNGEYNSKSSPSSYYPGYDGCLISVNDAQIIADKYESLTGYAGGGFGKRNVERISGSFIARLDWNISDKHNLSLRYNFLDASDDSYSNYLSSFMFNGTGYNGISRTHSLVGELNSRISSSLYNSLRVGYTRVYDGRECDEYLPYVTISKLRDGDRTSVSIGTDPYCGMNSLNQNTITISDHLSIYKGNHTITVGTHNEIFLADNLYTANSLGSYTYNTLDDFLNDKPSSFAYTEAIGDPVDHVKTAQFALFLQDKWSIGNLTLTCGLRADIPVIFGTPLENQAFNSSDIAKKYDLKTNSKPRTSILWSPRVGFRWRAYQSANYTATLYGGVGFFSGRVPFVWITNCYSNTGVTENGYMLYGNDILPFGVMPTSGGTVSNPNINVVDSAFEYPQTLRATLGFEQRIGQGWNISVEGSYSKQFNNVHFDNYVAQNRGSKLYAVSAAAATEGNVTPFYDSSAKSQYASIYKMSNTDEGYSYSLIVSASKRFDFGLSASASYTFSHSYSTNDCVSSQASSNWGKNYSIDPYANHLTHSVFDYPHQIKASLSYSKRYGKLFGTTISLIYRATSGMRYSLTYYKNGIDVNGDSYRGNSLIYIPTESELQQMNFENNEQRQQFNAFIEANESLRSQRGSYSRRNSMQAPFEHHLDLHFAQDFYFGDKSNRKLQLTLDIMNLGNIFCKDWGAYYFIDDYKLSPVEIYALDDDGQGNKTPRYRYLGADVTKDDLLSRWQMQIGVRIVF